MTVVKSYAAVARAPFLLLPPTLIAAGATASAWDGSFSWPRSALALIGLVLLHMAVNILNEWSDMRTGIDLATKRTPFSGGSGTLPAGRMSMRAALVFGLVCAGIGLLIGLWFLHEVGWVLLPVIVAGAFSVLAYTDFLARIGVGEIFAGFGLGAGPVVGVALAQAGSWSTAAGWAAIPAFFMTFNLLFLNEFPDEEADRAGGRRNLVILLGRRAAAWVYSLAGLATPTAIALAVLIDALPPLCLAATLPSFLLVKPVRWALTDPSLPVPNSALGANVAWNLATNTMIALTLVASMFLRS